MSLSKVPRLLCLAVFLGLLAADAGAAGPGGRSRLLDFGQRRPLGQESSGATEAGPSELESYLHAYPKMSAFLEAGGPALEQALSAPPDRADRLAAEAEFKRSVGIPFARFFELHATVAAVFAEELAEQARLRQLAEADEELQAVRTSLATRTTAAAQRKGLEGRLSELLEVRTRFERPTPRDPAVSPGLRRLVGSRHAEVERVYSAAEARQELSPEEKATLEEERLRPAVPVQEGPE
jgi:hypothetical protein